MQLSYQTRLHKWFKINNIDCTYRRICQTVAILPHSPALARGSFSDWHSARLNVGQAFLSKILRNEGPVLSLHQTRWNKQRDALPSFPRNIQLPCFSKTVSPSRRSVILPASLLSG